MSDNGQLAVQAASEWLTAHQISWDVKSRGGKLYLQLPLPSRYGGVGLVPDSGVWTLIADIVPDATESYVVGRVRQEPEQVFDAVVIRLLSILIEAIPVHPELMDGFSAHLYRLATAVRNDELAAMVVFYTAESHSPLAPLNVAAQEAFRRVTNWASGRSVGWVPQTDRPGRPALVLPQPFSAMLSSWCGRWAAIYELPDGRNGAIPLIDFDEEPEALVFSALLCLIRIGEHHVESDPWDALSFAHAARDLVGWCRDNETDETWTPVEHQALNMIRTLHLPEPTWHRVR